MGERARESRRPRLSEAQRAERAGTEVDLVPAPRAHHPTISLETHCLHSRSPFPSLLALPPPATRAAAVRVARRAAGVAAAARQGHGDAWRRAHARRHGRGRHAPLGAGRGALPDGRLADATARRLHRHHREGRAAVRRGAAERARLARVIEAREIARRRGEGRWERARRSGVAAVAWRFVPWSVLRNVPQPPAMPPPVFRRKP